jgi:hypothetical protein
LEQQQAGAFSEGLLSRVLNFLWGGITSRGIQGATKVDDVEPVKYHLITIPDAMGQHLSEIQNHVYVTRDPVPELTLSQEFNVTLSNIADATSKFLYAGKGLATGDARRRLAYFACQDPAYSAPRETSILDYALGLRIGCDPDELPDAVCDGTAFAELLGGSNSQGIGNNPTTEKAVSLFNSMRSRLTPELIKIYAVAGDMTGVPCEILAGIHYVESDLNPQGSLVSGRPLGDPEPDAGGKVFKTLLDTAIYAGDHLKTKVDGNLRDIPTLITALSRYNGGGNSNCQLGYPWPIPYDNCPRRWEGEDDPYAVNWLDPRHNVMYLLFCADSTACEPQEWERSGAFTFALTMYQQMTSQGGTPTEGGN